MLSILTFNAAIKDVRILGKSMYSPTGYIDKRLEALAEYLKKLNADIVCLQEVFHANFQHRLYSFLNSAYPFAAGFAREGIKTRLGNELLILSKYPLRNEVLIRFNHAALEERIFTSKGIYRVEIILPEIGELHFYNFHMSAGGLLKHPESRHMESIRSSQIKQLLDTISDDVPVILAGDLNAGPEASQINYREILDEGYMDAFTLSEGEGVTWDPENPLVKLSNEGHLPPQRIDHVFVNPLALEYLRPVTSSVVLNESIVELTDGNTIPVSDHYGLQVKFSLIQQTD